MNHHSWELGKRSGTSWLVALFGTAFVLALGLIISPDARAAKLVVNTVDQIASSPELPNSLMIAFQETAVPMYSTNGGYFWSPVTTTPWGSSAKPLRIAIVRRSDATNPRLIVAVSSLQAGSNLRPTIYRSGDGGDTWAMFRDGNDNTTYCSGPEAKQLVIAPKEPQQLYALFASSEAGLLGCVTVWYLYSSGDGGVNWSLINQSYPGRPTQIVSSPVVAGRVYIQLKGGPFVFWYVSDDRGQTLSPFVVEGDILSPDSVDANILSSFALNLNAGFRTINAGQTWVAWQTQPCPGGGDVQLLAHPTISKVLFLRCNGSLYKSANAGDSWQTLSTSGEQFIAADYGNPGRLLRAREDGLWASTDVGASWTHLTSDYNFQPFRVLFPLINKH